MFMVISKFSQRIICPQLLLAFLWLIDDGIVSQSTPETKCGNPAVPVNARVTLSSENLIPGSTATYSCDDGYEIFGSDVAVCSPNGLWSGELPFCGINVALRKPANQSTTVRGGSAVNANDGEKTTVHDGKRCTETMKESSPWWQVDLLRPYPIRIVRVTTRGCCGHQPLQDLEIRVGNSSSELQRNPLCAWFPGTIEEGVTKTFTCARMLVGQFVFLQMVGMEGSLSLCEVEIFTNDEFSNDRCAPAGISNDAEITSFSGICYEFNVAKGGSFEDARNKCKLNGGDLVHGFKAATTTFLLGELDRRKDRLKTQLVWIGAQKEPGFTSRTYKWVNGEIITKPSWGKDQPNNYNGEQNCIVLDGGRNWLWNDVGCNLDYLHWICQHPPASCGSPDKQVNTTIIGNDKHVGAIIQYKCPEGHMLIGDRNRTCTEEGFWSGQSPSCLYVSCGKLNDIDNGIVTLNNGKTSYEAVAKYTCKSNYTLIGTDTRICGEGGVWSGSQPQCLFDWCPDPPQINGGLISLNGKRTGSVATYTCQPGYILFGQKELTCGIGGEWSGKAPACKYVDCGAPPNIDNGQYNLINGTTTHGSIVEYSCNEDYWLEPISHRRQMCLREGKWSSEPPQCELITCGEPDVPPGGYVVGYDFNVHSSIEFHCEPGHLLKGQSTLECTALGEWNGTPPACQYIDCGKLSPLLYGSINYLNSSTHLDSEVMYSCTRNYRLTGAPVRRCLGTQSWSGTAPRCEEIRCPEPIIPDHSIISVTGNDRVYGRTLIRTSHDSSSITTYKIGALVKYRCERGYKILGDPLSTCEDTGHWGGEIPQCVFVDCGLPGTLDNGHFMLTSNVTYYGSAVIYECKQNYELDGYARRLCMENGTWSAETPVCKEILCKEPEVGENMVVNVSVRSVGGIAQYRCTKGQYMEGNLSRECTSKGHWTGKVPVCKQPVECTFGILANKWRILYRPLDVSIDFCDTIIKACCVLHNFVRSRDGINFTDMAYECHLNSVEIQSQTRTIRATNVRNYFATYFTSPNGSVAWQYAIECEQPPSIENGRVIIMNQSTTYNSAIEYHCIPHYQRIGPYLRKCMDDGRWSGEEPRCEFITGNDESQTISFALNIGVGVILFLLILLGLIYLKLKKAKPVKNTENIQGAICKEEQGAAAMSYASLSDINNSNIYENIAENMYDTPYEGIGHYEPAPLSHYEPSPISRCSNRSSVTVNGRKM